MCCVLSGVFLEIDILFSIGLLDGLGLGALGDGVDVYICNSLVYLNFYNKH